MTRIIDASVALKWVIEEDDSAAAMALLLGEPLAAPDFLATECANVLWARARHGVIKGEDARAGLAESWPLRFNCFRARAMSLPHRR